MSKKFNLNDYKGAYVMHCKTEEEAMDFCRVLHEAGMKWSNGNSYLVDSEWCDYTDRTCYNFNNNRKCHIDWYKDCGFIILEWSDFMNNDFTKDDLKNGDVVLRRDGDVEIYIQGKFIDECGGGASQIFINKDLTSISATCRDRDIIAVRRPVDISDMSFDAFEKKLGRLVYERDETVEMTIEEVCKALGKNVKIVKEVKS